MVNSPVSYAQKPPEVPLLQVFVGGEFVGGSDEALKLLDEGQLLQKGSGDSDTGLPDKLRHAVDSAAQDFEVHLTCVQAAPTVHVARAVIRDIQGAAAA